MKRMIRYTYTNLDRREATAPVSESEAGSGFATGGGGGFRAISAVFSGPPERRAGVDTVATDLSTGESAGLGDLGGGGGGGMPPGV